MGTSGYNSSKKMTRLTGLTVFCKYVISFGQPLGAAVCLTMGKFSVWKLLVTGNIVVTL